MRRALGRLALLPVLAACSGDPEFTYGAELEAPPRSAYERSSDEDPTRDHGRADLELDSGAKVIIWIDPGDYRLVLVQHSDPDDADSWTEPERLFEGSGDGCLFVHADTDGEVVAATLGCYHHDAFLQQAPTAGHAAVTTNLEDWRLEDFGEFWGEPHVEDGTVEWDDSSVSWSEDDGFTD
ncbi:hypothetical protein HNR19_003118 [Nocardioides thalensis]|uniref:Uncharacterized protein n=1 Tax=Nocardioides thalensis TaxID=1914755 RepID=A0A853C2K6_9ACTN|nr:hypothetical protein [Nocardioides thalensis]NYJ02420.1 hypothetical protein [Nocardioides thalensis]